MPFRFIRSIVGSSAVLLLSAILAKSLFAASNSDLLIILDADGTQFLAQQTLATDEELLLLELPVGRTPLQAQFSGPERQTFSTAHQQNPNTLSLWSGEVITRYQHVYSEALTTLEDQSLELNIRQAHPSVESDNPDSLTSTMTWVLPTGATLISFSPAAADNSASGIWTHTGNTVSFSQQGGSLPELFLRYALLQEEPEVVIDPCVAVLQPTDECSPDIDADEIPDYRDICLPLENASVTPSTRPGEDVLGCDAKLLFVLQNVNFQVGNSYLDAASRDVLDRVALALQRVPEQVFEVSAHTDNVGSDQVNQRLSENRATSVRHYLMLRGVGPNQLTGVGYGEQNPVASNDTNTGRRTNRRVELKRIN